MVGYQFRFVLCEGSEASHVSVCISFVRLSSQFQLEVQRSVVRVQEFLRDLRMYFANDVYDEDCTQSAEPEHLLSVEQLQSALNKLITENSHLIIEPWDCQVLVTFLDDGPVPSCLDTVAFRLMKNKIISLENSCQRSKDLIECLQPKYAALADQIQAIKASLRRDFDGHHSSFSRFPPVHCSSSVSIFDPSHSPGSAVTLPEHSDPSHFTEATAHAPALSPIRCAESSEGPFSLILPDKTQLGSSVSPLLQSRTVAGALGFSPPSASSTTSTMLTSSPVSMLPTSRYLPSSVYVQTSETISLNRALDELIIAISPQEAQVQCRDSIVALLQRNIRHALKCGSFEVGLPRLLCFLPDDPVKVSAVLSYSHSPSWQIAVCHRLNYLAGRRPEFDEPPELDSIDSVGGHMIRKVIISNSQSSVSVRCSVDLLDVEITCNSRADMCMLVLLEEIAVLVGKNDLFQRSLQAIRAWWNYECAAYVGTSIKYYLSDFSLCLMVAAIFNQHHARIHTPLQALCAFLAEYSQYDGTTSAITLMGIAPFKSATDNSPLLTPHLCPSAASPNTPSTNPTSGFLLSQAVLERHWLLFCPPGASNLDSHSFSTENLFNKYGLSELHSGDATSTSPPQCEMTAEGIALQMHQQICAHNLAQFHRGPFNIVDPFTCQNMVTERLSHDRLARMVKVFQTGAQKMFDLLTQSAHSLANPRQSLSTFFPQTLSKFCYTLTRPDTFSADRNGRSSGPSPRKVLMKVSLDKLLRQMRYSNLMVESVISRSAVLDLAVEILTQRGPLPIGEVGKTMAEFTGVVKLSSRLKETYGGLRNLLESFSSVLIVGTDHPYNPHIVLRSSLSQKDLILNDSGVFPINAVLSIRKVSAKSLRKAAYYNSKLLQSQQASTKSSSSLSPVSTSPVAHVVGSLSEHAHTSIRPPRETKTFDLPARHSEGDSHSNANVKMQQQKQQQQMPQMNPGFQLTNGKDSFPGECYQPHSSQHQSYHTSMHAYDYHRSMPPLPPVPSSRELDTRGLLRPYAQGQNQMSRAISPADRLGIALLPQEDHHLPLPPVNRDFGLDSRYYQDRILTGSSPSSTNSSMSDIFINSLGHVPHVPSGHASDAYFGSSGSTPSNNFFQSFRSVSDLTSARANLNTPLPAPHIEGACMHSFDPDDRHDDGLFKSL